MAFPFADSEYERWKRRMAGKAPPAGSPAATAASVREQVQQPYDAMRRQAAELQKGWAPPPEGVKAIESLHTDDPDADAAKTLAKNTDTIMRILQARGVRTPAPDVLLALTMSGLGPRSVDELVKMNPMALAFPTGPEAEQAVATLQKVTGTEPRIPEKGAAEPGAESALAKLTAPVTGKPHPEVEPVAPKLTPEQGLARRAPEEVTAGKAFEKFRREASPTYAGAVAGEAAIEEAQTTLTPYLTKLAELEELAAQGRGDAAALLEELKTQGITRSALESLDAELKKESGRLLLEKGQWQLSDWRQELKEAQDARLVGELFNIFSGRHPKAGGAVAPAMTATIQTEEGSVRGKRQLTGEQGEGFMKTAVGLNLFPGDDESGIVFLGRPPDEGNPLEFEYTRKYWESRGMSPESPVDMETIERRMEDFAQGPLGYKKDVPASFSKTLQKFQQAFNRFYKNPDGSPMFPVPETGRLDDPSTYVAVARLNYERSRITAAIAPEDSDVFKRARGFIDSYVDWMEFRRSPIPGKSDPWFNPEIDVAYAAGGLTEADTSKSFAERSAAYTTRQETVRALNDFFNFGIPAYRSSGNDIRKLAPDIASVQDEFTRSELYRRQFAGALTLKDPTVSDAEFTTWWADRFSDDAVPEDARSLIVSRGLVTTTVKDFLKGVSGYEAATQVVDSAQKGWGALPEPVRKDITRITDTVAEVLGKLGSDAWEETKEYYRPVTVTAEALKVPEAAGAALEGVGAVAEKGIEAAVYPFDLFHRGLMSLWFTGRMDTDRMSAKQERLFEAEARRLQVEDPYDYAAYGYSHPDLQDFRDYVMDFGDAWEKAGREQEEDKGFHNVAVEDVLGYDLKRDPALELFAGLAVDFGALKGYYGAAGRSLKALLAPAAREAVFKLGFINPQLKSLEELGEVARSEERLQAKLDEVTALKAEAVEVEKVLQAETAAQSALKTARPASAEPGLALARAEETAAKAGARLTEYTERITELEAQGYGGIRPYAVYQLNRELGYHEKLLDSLRFTAGEGDAASRVSRYADANDLDNAGLVEMFEDNLVSMSRRGLRQMTDKGLLGGLPHVVKKLTVTYPYTGMGVAPVGNLMKKVEDMAVASGLKPNEVAYWVDRYFYRSTGGGSKERAFRKVKEEMEDALAAQAAERYFGGAANAPKAKEAVLSAMGMSLAEWEPTAHYLPKPFRVGGKKSPAYAEVEGLRLSAGLEQFERRAGKLADDWRLPKAPQAPAAIAEEELVTIRANIRDEYAEMAARVGVEAGDDALDSFADRFVDEFVAAFAAAPRKTPTSADELLKYLAPFYRAEGLADEMASFMLSYGLNPMTSDVLVGLRARAAGLAYAARESGGFFTDPGRIATLAKGLAPNEDMARFKTVMAELSRTAEELGAAHQVAVFPFQVEMKFPTLMKELAFFRDHGPRGLMNLLTKSTLDSYMRVWRFMVLFGLGTQFRIFGGDEFLRLVDQGIDPMAVLGRGKFKGMDVPWHLKEKREAKHSFMDSFTSRAFTVMGGPGGQPYDRRGFNWLLKEMTSGETGKMLFAWMKAEAKTVGEGRKVLAAKYGEAAEGAVFAGDMTLAETAQKLGLTRVLEMQNAAGKKTATDMAVAIDTFFRHSLRANSDPEMRRIISAALGSPKKKSIISQAEFDSLLGSWAERGLSLPRVMLPKRWLADIPLPLAEGMNAAFEKLSNAAFYPLEQATKMAKAGVYRDFNLRKLESLTLEGQAPSGAARAAAEAYAVEKVNEVVYRGFQTSYDHALRNVFPFAAAWRNYLMYWTRRLAERPSRALVWAWMQDRIPEEMEAPGSSLSRQLLAQAGLEALAPLTTFRIHPRQVLFMTGGVGGYVPAFGPLVTVPVSALREWKPDTFDWLGSVPGLAFTNPNSPMFAKVDKLIYGLTGKVPGWPSWARHLPKPLGFSESYLENIKGSEYRWLAADYLEKLGFADAKQLSQKNIDDLSDLGGEAERAVEDSFLMQFAGQYLSPAGFTVTTPGRQLDWAVRAWRDSSDTERTALVDVLMGKPGAALPGRFDEHFLKELPDGLKGRFLDVTEALQAPSDEIPSRPSVYSSDELKMLKPHLIPYLARAEYDPRLGAAPVEKVQEAVIHEFENTATAVYGKGWRSIRATKDIGGLMGTRKRVELQKLAAELAKQRPSGELEPQYRLPTGENLKDLIDALPRKSEKPSSEDRAKAAALAVLEGGPKAGGLEVERLKALEPAVRQASFELVLAAAEKKEAERTDADWERVGRPNENTGAWGQVWQAEKYYEKLMKDEQGETVTFSSKAGRSYAAQLDAKLAEIETQAGPEWMERYRLSKGPRWRVLEADRVGLDDPETAAQWRQTYEILRSMTERMAGVKASKEKAAIHAEATVEIDKLKAENETFKRQLAEVNKGTLKPTTSQLRAYKGDYATVAPKKGGGRGRRRGIRKGRRGKRGGVKRSRSSVGSVSTFKGKRRKRRI